MGLKVFQIVFDNASETFYPGQTVSGRVLLSLSSPKTVRGILIKFKGEANVQWTETESRKNSDGTTEEHTVYFQGNEKYFESKYHLFGGHGDEMVLSEGEHCFPFSTVLPTKLPSSFEGEFGHIRYTVKTVIDRPWKFDHEIKSAFTVLSAVDLNIHATAKNPLKQEVEKRFCCLCCQSGPLTMVLSLPVTGYVPGQDIPVTLEIDNASNICVTDVKCKLKQLITFIATSPYGSSREEEITVAEVIFDAVQPGGSSTAIQKITVPPLPPSDLDNCEIIDLAYYLKVVAEVSGCHSALKTSAPIVLGTIPLISYQTPFAPVPKGGGDICGDIGWTVPSVGPSYVQPNIPPPGESHTVPSAPQLEEKEESEEPRMPDHGPTAPLYPDIPPPTFAESILGPMNIQDAEDNQYTQGNLSYVPRYPVYNFTIEHYKVAKKSPYPYLTYHVDLYMRAIWCAECSMANGMLVQMLTVLPHTNFKSQCTWCVSADPHGKQAGVLLTFPQPLCISIQIKAVEQQIFLSAFYVLCFSPLGVIES